MRTSQWSLKTTGHGHFLQRSEGYWWLASSASRQDEPNPSPSCKMGLRGGCLCDLGLPVVTGLSRKRCPVSHLIVDALYFPFMGGGKKRANYWPLLHPPGPWMRKTFLSHYRAILSEQVWTMIHVWSMNREQLNFIFILTSANYK